MFNRLFSAKFAPLTKVTRDRTLQDFEWVANRLNSIQREREIPEKKLICSYLEGKKITRKAEVKICTQLIQRLMSHENEQTPLINQLRQIKQIEINREVFEKFKSSPS